MGIKKSEELLLVRKLRNTVILEKNEGRENRLKSRKWSLEMKYIDHNEENEGKDIK